MATQPLSPPPTQSAVTNSAGLLAPSWATWVQQLWESLKAGAPQTPTFEHGWTAGLAAPRYRRLGSGLVVLEGKLVAGTVGSSAFTLPESMRPSQEVAYAANSATALGIIVVDAVGTVRPIVCPGADIAMDFVFLAAS